MKAGAAMELILGTYIFLLMALGIVAVVFSLYAAYSGLQHRRMMERDRLGANTHIAILEQDVAYLAAGKLQNTQGGEGFVDPRRGLVVRPTIAEVVSAHYAPHIIIKEAPYAQQLRARETDTTPTINVAAPSFRAMLQNNIFAVDKLVRGFEAGLPIDMPIILASVMALGGLPGSGKTTAQRFFAGQRVSVGSRLIAIDMHGDVSDQSLIATLQPLSAFYALPPAIETRDIAAVLREILAEVERRRKGAACVPWLVMIDELNALMRSPNADLAATTIRVLGEEARKLNIQGFVSGQNWKAEEVGGSPVRDSLALRTCTRMIPLQAQRLIPTVNRDVFELPNGAAYSYASGDLRRLDIPNVTGDDLAYLAETLTDETPGASAQNRPEIGQKYAGIAPAYPASEQAKVVSAEAIEAAGLFLSGEEPAAIVRRLRGIDSKAGARYQTALKEIHGLIREGLPGSSI